MADCVLLMKLTDKGVRAAKDIPARIAEGTKAWGGDGRQDAQLPCHDGPV
jgi:uncharacterized protein with GYD domain